MREGSNKLENRMRMRMGNGHGHEGGGRNVTTATTYHTRHRPGLGSTAYFFQVDCPRLRFLFPTSLHRPKKSRHTCGTPAPIGSGMPGIKFRAGRRNFVKTRPHDVSSVIAMGVRWKEGGTRGRGGAEKCVPHSIALGEAMERGGAVNNFFNRHVIPSASKKK